MGVPFSRLPLKVRERLLKKNPELAKRKKKRKNPAQDSLVAAIEARFPGRSVAEYKPFDSRKFRIDIAFPDERLAVEFDGWEFHGKYLKDFKSDRRRQNFMAINGGWRFLRYFYCQINNEMEMVLDEIDEALKTIRSLPQKEY